MNALRLFVLTVLVILASMAGVRAVWAANGDLVEVFIDARQPAYVVFQSVAEDTPVLARQEMVGYAALEKVSLVPWIRFRDNVQSFIADGIVKNEYPNSRTALGILAILKSRPGRPVAITWNGGIAASFFDFQHAVQTYRAFQQDAERYERERRRDVADDPLNPELHLRMLQGG